MDILIRIAAFKLAPMNDSENSHAFQALMRTIESRRDDPPERSYTTSLLEGGTEKIGRKIVEEAAEVVEAADESGTEGEHHLVHEAADLIYHLFVMLAFRNIPLDRVSDELRRRFGVSGLDEKESRSNQPKE